MLMIIITIHNYINILNYCIVLQNKEKYVVHNELWKCSDTMKYDNYDTIHCLHIILIIYCRPHRQKTGETSPLFTKALYPLVLYPPLKRKKPLLMLWYMCWSSSISTKHGRVRWRWQSCWQFAVMPAWRLKMDCAHGLSVHYLTRL